ncbi:deoxyribodipyrimidine photo-lyase-like [Ptychodera flava]|uniref:deoxyribodipyrimidine photo-lyase-like n=1 Tax=Ptychodera flava TaxID=63121 RepID=UPI00396AA37E
MAEPPQKKVKAENGETVPSGNSVKVENGGIEDFIEKIEAKRRATAGCVSDFRFNKKRIRLLSDVGQMPDTNNGIVYWMSRDQRVQDNWALLYAQRLALKEKVPLHVCFCLVPSFLEATIRQYGFMLKGLQEVENELNKLDITFHLLIGYAKDVLPEFVKSQDIGGVVTDFSPLRIPLKWVSDVAKELPDDVPFCQIDAHNIVPCWEASPKQEYSARTIRSKIHNQLSPYLTQFPAVCVHPHKAKTKSEPIDWSAAKASLEVDRTVAEVDWAMPGTSAGLRMLESFCKHRLRYFNADRNNPNKTALSNMSPWFHFGQVSVQRAILEVRGYRSKYKESVEGYVEEAIIRRELSDNFCFYNKKYDSVDGAHDWAKKTLQDHAQDKREYVYSRDKLEEAKTHDDLWNAAQIQMVNEGKMHGFLRMYWAKKILEWTESPEQALEFAIYLNDKYELDGRDPNGYVGCMWSICGTHDQGWAERAVFGKIRFMNYQGCKRKFDVAAFVKKYRAKKY